MKPATAGWVFAGPALLVIALFFGLPVLAAFALSLTDFDIYALADLDNMRFVGLHNYLALLQNPLFWKALGNTFYFRAGRRAAVDRAVAGGGAAAALAPGALHRLLPHRLLRAGGHHRGGGGGDLALPVPHPLRPGELGTVAAGVDPVDWLGDPHWAMPTIILFAVWKNYGYNMVILLAGLQAIPRTCTRPRASTAPAPGRSSATSPCPCSAR
jgi:multiple sugar transport system permease protein